MDVVVLLMMSFCLEKSKWPIKGQVDFVDILTGQSCCLSASSFGKKLWKSSGYRSVHLLHYLFLLNELVPSFHTDNYFHNNNTHTHLSSSSFSPPFTFSKSWNPIIKFLWLRNALFIIRNISRLILSFRQSRNKERWKGHVGHNGISTWETWALFASRVGRPKSYSLQALE